MRLSRKLNQDLFQHLMGCHMSSTSNSGSNPDKSFQLVYPGESLCPQNYRKALTRLIPKVEGVPSIDQLRPITLQNCEYKILSKVMTRRLLGSMDLIINPWQHCAIPGRNITQPLIRTLSTVEYINQHHWDDLSQQTYSKHTIELIWGI